MDQLIISIANAVAVIGIGLAMVSLTVMFAASVLE